MLLKSIRLRTWWCAWGGRWGTHPGLHELFVLSLSLSDPTLRPSHPLLPPRLNKPFLDYGDTVMYGLEASPVSWLRNHAHWGR